MTEKEFSDKLLAAMDKLANFKQLEPGNFSLR
jgi:hypothetical protein